MDKKPLNEFRQDLVSGEWVLFATGRAKSLRDDENKDFYQTKRECPFEDLSQQTVVWKYPDENNVSTIVIKNKYPAVRAGLCTTIQEFGPFKTFDPVGDHEVIIFKEHDHGIYMFSADEFKSMVKVYKKRFLELTKESECAKYILIFHNQGKTAGASLYHPHSQIITMPILPPDVAHSINGSFEYYKKHKKRVYAELLEWEQKERKRIVYENKEFIVFCPYVSKYPYELRIFSKESHAHFHQISEASEEFLADAIYTSLQKMKGALDSPPFNMFVHTAPLANDFGVHTHEFYHWHIEIIPHLKIDAGFEMGTGIEVNPVDPDESAEVLRNANIQQ
jgi:UDPglucose--hexose-1-phosphate uridylyltransferase